jgi:hypothetical protein
MFQVCFNHRFPLGGDAFHYLPLVIWEGIPLLDCDGAFRTMPEAGSQAVAEEVADQPGLAVNDLERPFRTARNAQSATVALALVNANDFAPHGDSPALGFRLMLDAS